jgi:hypothetical protein
MLHRIFAMLIVGFWIAMTGLLVVREMYPEATRLNTVPVNYVGSLVFQHNQSSDLQVYDGPKEVGYIHMQPRLEADKKKRIIELHGNLTISPLGIPRQRLSWIGSVSLDQTNEVQRIWLDISTQDPPNRLFLTIDSQKNTATYEVRSGNQVVDHNTITLDREGFSKLLERVGIDTSLLQQFQSTSDSTPPPELSAQQSSTRLNGETIPTFLLSMKVSGQTLFEAHVSQLGQVVRAQAPLFGYKMVPYNVRP